MAENKIEYTKDDLNDDYSNDDLLNIQSWGVDLSIQDLLFQYKQGDILKPELQRNYVWEKKEASRFIESLLLGLPVPSIFLANMPDDTRLIVDGYQRIMTLYHYIIVGKWKETHEVFKLYNSSLINEKWRNKSFAELEPTEQRRLRLYTIHAIVFEQKKPKGDSSLYQIFERINTSGKTLLPQEIRNCVCQGAMNTLLIKLNKNEDWRFLYGSAKQDERMRDIELILRFFAMNTPEVYNSNQRYISLKMLLNAYMCKHIKASPDFLQSCFEDFSRTVSFIKEHFREESFYNLQKDNSKYRKKLYPTVFDSLMIATSIALKRGYVYNGENLAALKLTLLSTQEFKDCITQGTMQVENIRRRISMMLEKIYNFALV